MRFVVRAFFQAAVALTLCGCLDNTRRDHDACVLKAIEIYKKEPMMMLWMTASGLYVYRCMNVAGYTLDDSIKECTGFRRVEPLERITPLPMVALIPGCWKPKS